MLSWMGDGDKQVLSSLVIFNSNNCSLMPVKSFFSPQPTGKSVILKSDISLLIENM